MDQFPRAILGRWAFAQPQVLGLYVFGSRAREEARPDSDLDLALELDDARDNELSVLIVNCERWKKELSLATGLVVKDLYLRNDEHVTGPVIEAFRRA
jgi:predicted nucleotidyltransferase